MRLRRRSRVAWVAWVLLASSVVAGGLLVPATTRAQGVTVSLLPSGITVQPGAEFDLDLRVIQEGLAFNGFDAYIGFDPAALTLVPLSPVALQEGALMTGACGNTFHLFSHTTSTASITDVLLCNGLSLTGPGQIYRLHFLASNTPQVTEVQFLPGLQFYNDGLYVNPAYSNNATINIGTAVDAGALSAPSKLQLRVAPNPARGGTVFTIEADRAGLQRLRVIDLRGRVVRKFEDSVSTEGVRTVAWDGRDSAGRQLPPGLYLATLEVAGRSASRLVSLIR